MGLTSASMSEASRDNDRAWVYSPSSGSTEGMMAWKVGVNVAEADWSTKISR